MPTKPLFPGTNWVGIVSHGPKPLDHQAEVIEDYADSTSIPLRAILFDHSGIRTSAMLEDLADGDDSYRLVFYNESYVHQGADFSVLERLLNEGKVVFARPVSVRDRSGWVKRFRTKAIKLANTWNTDNWKNSTEHKAAVCWIQFLTSTCQFSREEIVENLRQFGLNYRWGLQWTVEDVRLQQEAFFKAEGLKEGMGRDVWMPKGYRDQLLSQAIGGIRAAGLIS